MIPLKWQSTPMLHRLNKVLVILSLLTACLSGCYRTQQTYTVENWLEDTVEVLKIKESTDPTTILKEWDMLKFEPVLNDPLTLEILAATLNCWFFEAIESTIQLKNESIYKEDIIQLIEREIIFAKEASNPKQLINRNVASKILQRFIKQLNEQTVPLENMIDGNQIVEATPIQVDFNKLTAHFNKSLQIGDLVTWSSDESTYLYEVQDITNGKTSLELPSIDKIDSIQLFENDLIDFENAVIEFDQDLEPIESIAISNEYQWLSSTSKNTKMFTSNGFEIKTSYTSTSFSVSASKKLKNNNRFYVEFDLSNVKPIISFKGTIHQLDLAQLKLNYQCDIKSGFDRVNQISYNFDPKNQSLSEWAKSLLSLWNKDEEGIDVEIPIATLKIPIEGLPLCVVKIKIKLILYASGKAEFAYSLNNSHGFEIRNNKLRMINDTRKDVEFVIEADTGVATDLVVSLDLLEQSLMDLSVEAGIEAKLENTVHFPEKSESIELNQIPYDVLDKLSLHNSFVVCSDIDMYWKMQFKVNSMNTLAGKLGLSKSIDFLNKSNASLFKNGIGHLENGLFVKRCTRSTNFNTPLPTLLTNLDRIILQNYSKIIKVNETEFVEVRGLPENYSMNDLVFNSSKPNVAIVDDHGSVTAISRGNTLITITTKDNAFEVSMNVMVVE